MIIIQIFSPDNLISSQQGEIEEKKSGRSWKISDFQEQFAIKVLITVIDDRPGPKPVGDMTDS